MFSIVFYAFELHTFCLLGSIPCRFFSCPQMMVCHNKIKITKGYSIRNYSPSSLSILQGKENIKNGCKRSHFTKLCRTLGEARGGVGEEELLQENHYQTVSIVYIKLPFLQSLHRKFMNHSQTKWSIPLQSTLMNWLFEYWTH